MQSQFEQLREDLTNALANVVDMEALERVRVEFLGRKGRMTELMKGMATLADEERKLIGKLANEVKLSVEAGFSQKQSALEREAAAERAQTEWIDITEPGTGPTEGHLHPVSSVIAEITDIFASIGFSRARAPEIDWDWYAFESLNMPKDHPARDDWETFFVTDTRTANPSMPGQVAEGEKGRIVLTPHTSNAQVRILESTALPVRKISIGRTYRRQSDVTHTPMFHQFEGLMVGEGLSVAHLKGVLDHFAERFFGTGRNIRLRPHHFRFTEPSFEVDISCGNCNGDASVGCRLCKSGWLELGGAGMVHPNVLKAAGLNPDEVTGFAFGWGVERTLMMRSGMKIDDIRILYRTDLRFAKQF